MTVWTHTQGVYPDRAGIAEMLRVPPASVRLIHVEGSGCYGHNGADDAAADAALIARAMPGVPVRVQWMREQEHAWEPFGPAMVTKLKASLDGNGAIVDWNFEVWSNTHSMRPGGAGSMLAAQHMAQPFALPAPKPLPLPEGGGDRNAIPFYKFPNAQGGASLHPGNAAADFGDARARRLSQRVLDREFHGRTRARCRRRPGRVPAEASRRRARARRDRKGRKGIRLAEGPEGAAGSRLRLCLCALQESRRLLRHRDRGRGQPRRAAVRGWCARWRRSTAGKSSIRTG